MKNRKIVILYCGLFSTENDILMREAKLYLMKRDYKVLVKNLYNDIENITVNILLEEIKRIEKNYPNNTIIHIGHSFSGFVLALYKKKTKSKNITVLWEATDMSKRKNNNNFFNFNKKNNSYLVKDFNVTINSIFYKDIVSRKYNLNNISENNSILVINSDEELSEHNYYELNTLILKNADHNFSTKENKDILFKKTYDFIESY